MNPMFPRMDLSDLPDQHRESVCRRALNVLSDADQTLGGEHRILDAHGDWGPSQFCTNSAAWLAYHLNGRVIGYNGVNNPDARIGEEGHDFCVAGPDDQFLLDYWVPSVQGTDHPGLLRRNDPRVTQFYGDPRTFEVVRFAPENLPVESIESDHPLIDPDPTEVTPS